MSKFFSKNLYLGSDASFPSITQEKRAILTSQLALLCLAISLFFTISDLTTGYTDSFLIYILLTIVGLTSFILNRLQLTTVAKVIVIAGANFVVFITFEAEGVGTGSYAFFITCIIGVFAIFGYDQRTPSVVLSLLSVLLFFISNTFDFEWLTKASFSPEEQHVYFAINFGIAMATTIVIILFLLKLNHLSERKLIKTGEELVANRLRFELAIKGSSVGIWDWDIANDSLFLSPLMIKQLNYPPEKYVNMTSDKINKVVHPQDLTGLKSHLQLHLEKKKKYYSEFRLRKGDGTYFWVLVSGQAQWDKKGNPLRMVGTVVDINELKEAVKKQKQQNTLLEKANEELDRFVYSTSHDLRAPLTSILGLVQIAERSDDKEEINQCLNMIEDRVGAMKEFIAEIIDYSRNSRLDISNEKVFVKKLVEEVIDGLKYFEKSEEIEFTIDIPKSLVFFSDKGRLKIILNNIIANAVKYHDFNKEKPFINIQSILKTDRVLILVQDNGLGIPEELQRNIFNMFFRGSEKSEGSGLGLYIAKEMTTKLSGKISLESTQGEGSTFTVQIPFEKVIKGSKA